MGDPAKTVRPRSGGAARDQDAGLSAPLRRLAGQLAKQVRDEHGLLDKRTAERFGRLLTSSVTRCLKPGRKPSPEVLRACELRRKGLPWPKVYLEVIPGYWSLAYPDRFWKSHKLRDAVRAHRRRHDKSRAANRRPERTA